MGVDAVSGTVDALVFSVRAEPRAYAIAAAIDAVVIGGLAAASALALARGAAPIGLLLLLLALAAFAGTAASLAIAGRSLGALSTGIRTVERSTGTPSGGRLVADLLAGVLVTCDIRRGRDPIAPAIAPFHFPERAPSETARSETPRNAVAVLDSGQRLPFARALVIGRNPVTEARGDQRFSWPDLSRTLSKTHARLTCGGRDVWATDLGSANGSAMQVGGELVALAPFVPMRMPTDAVLWLGDRSVTIARAPQHPASDGPGPRGGADA